MPATAHIRVGTLKGAKSRGPTLPYTLNLEAVAIWHPAACSEPRPCIFATVRRPSFSDAVFQKLGFLFCDYGSSLRTELDMRLRLRSMRFAEQGS